MEYNNKTDRYFSDRLGSYEQSPPVSGWENISAKLEQRRKKRVMLLVFRIAAGMAILLSVGTAVYFLFNQSSGIDNNITEQTIIVDNTRDQNNSLNKSPGQHPVSTSGGNEKAEKSAVANNTRKESFSEKTEKSEISSLQADKQNLQDSPLAEVTNNGLATNPVQESVGMSEWLVLSRIENGIRSDNLINRSLRKESNKPKVLTEEEMIALLLGHDEQESETIIAKDKPWLLGSEVAPLYSYRTISSSNLQSDIVQNLNESESGVLAYAGGINVSYSTGKRLTIQSGLYYSRYGQDKNQVETFANRMADSDFGEINSRYILITNSTGTINAGMMKGGMNTDVRSDIGVISEMNYKYDYISNSSVAVSEEATDIMVRQLFDYFEFPVILKYKVIDRKIDFSINGGVITNFLIGNKLDLIENGRTTLSKSTSDINSVNYQGSVGMGLEYPVGDNFALTIEPRFRYYINAIDKKYGIVHPFSFGLFTGINYRF